jgi:peroxiredoxin
MTTSARFRKRAAAAMLGSLLCLSAYESSAALHHPAEQAQPELQIPRTRLRRMPDFHLEDTRGQRVTLAQFRGKVLLVDFWATWCAPCKKEMPGYETLYRRYRTRGFAVVGIAADSDRAAVAKFGRKLGITYPLLINGMDVQRYGVQGLPTTILVDREGFIRKEVIGFEYTRVIEASVKQLLR